VRIHFKVVRAYSTSPFSCRADSTSPQPTHPVTHASSLAVSLPAFHSSLPAPSPLFLPLSHSPSGSPVCEIRVGARLPIKLPVQSLDMTRRADSDDSSGEESSLDATVPLLRELANRIAKLPTNVSHETASRVRFCLLLYHSLRLFARSLARSPSHSSVSVVRLLALSLPHSLCACSHGK